MEKHRCKLCFKSFVNGRALGGHMRSHMLNLPVPSKVEEPMNQPSQESDAASASYSSSSSDEEEEQKKGQFYGLRENPKRSIRMVDPEFVDAGSVVLQDRESETESSRNPTRKRSKRTRKILDQQQQQDDDDDDDDDEETKKLKVNINQLSKTESWAEPEPVSSISDTTTEEDVAFCLMMLSRDQWKSKVREDRDEDEDDEEDEEESDESEGYIKLSKVNNRTARAKYRCETCNKVFKSYQALGGHRASHKKIKANPAAATYETELKPENVATCSMAEKKVHECPVCFRVFSSGQALGGHKRSHITGQVAETTTKTAVKSSKKLGNSMIDLNLPAPVDDDDASQIELSAVSDAEFVK
ncbi:putative expansin-B2-like [Hibiscus syriacus]|uniref:Expansin-B2-like n=1 Tax=Hibiscus syriacus TaxID=106335 RepID=A0A6A3CFT1_HIBSY|nr:zinc finger protein ZAT9-like [Hibiscus syriacus]KAE8726162.1 putative expansin-B2-like [Hibiscus syriacus]